MSVGSCRCFVGVHFFGVDTRLNVSGLLSYIFVFYGDVDGCYNADLIIQPNEKSIGGLPNRVGNKSAICI